jgi:branched-chain amino acid transport system substrate-binding protein
MRLPARPVAPFVVAVCACLAAGCGLAACGGSSHHRAPNRRTVRPRAQTVEVYSSLPLVGPSGAIGRAVQRGIRLAWILADRRAGSFLVRYRSLDDARAGHGSWAAALTSANARQAAVDPAAMVYIGELDSSATEVSLPILNQAGIPQISPWSPYVGLTRALGDGVTAPGDPGRYYSSASGRTFLRLAPDDAVQAGALLEAAHAAGCTRMAVLRSPASQDYSSELSGLLYLERARFDVRIVSPGGSPPALPVAPAIAFRRYLDSLRALLTQCVVYVGAPSPAAVLAIAALHAALPRAALFGSDQLCQAAFGAGPLRAELFLASGGLLQCTYPALPSGSDSGRFLALWQTQYAGRPPAGPWAAYGYEAMRLALQAIAGLGTRGDQRSRVLHALFSQTSRGTLLGSYGFSSDGDSTVRAYGLWQVRAGGAPRLVRVMEPPAG